MLDELKTKRKSGKEKFTFKGKQIENATITDFWKWYCSDLINNALRGNLAEYIVAMSLGQKKNIQIGWAAWDLTYKGIKIEVKSSAYIQSWFQNNFSKITFGIGKSRTWDNQTNKLDDILERQADIYVFAILNYKDQKTIDPLKLDQWIFYVLDTKTINKELKNAKTVGIATLKRIGAVKCNFISIKKTLVKMSR